MMKDSEICQIVSAMEANSIGHGDSFISDNQDLFSRYKADPYGDEEPNKSKVVTTDCADVVESDMPSHVRVFLGANNIVEFTPTSELPEDIQEAEEKNLYIPHLIRTAPDSFKKQFDFLKSIEIYKAGVLEYGFRDTQNAEIKKVKGIGGDELTELMTEYQSDSNIKKLKVLSHSKYEVDGEERFDVEISLIRKKRSFFLDNVPIEDLILTKGAQTKDDADIVGKRWRKTRGELVAEGYDKDLVKSLEVSTLTEGSELKDARSQSTNGGAQTSRAGNLHWTMEEVSGIDVYVLIDANEDGVRERRHIIKSGNTLLENEDFDHVPFVIASAIQIPHNMIGMSRVEQTKATQRIQTVLSRGVINNVMMTNAGRNIVSSKINMDDMLAVRENGVVRYRGEDPITNHVMPLITPYVGDKTLQIIQYFDSRRAQTTGSLMANQGLQADDLHKETATRFNGIEESGAAKVELIARCIAEIAYVQLYNGVAWFARHYQDDEQEFAILGKQMRTTPASWKFEHIAESSVSNGAADGEAGNQTNIAIYSIQEQLKARGSLLVDEAKIYNQLKKLFKNLGVKDVSKFINNPEVPAETLMAENEQLKAMVQQMQQALEASSNPLAEAENIKAMKEIMIKQQQLESQNAQFAAQLQENKRQFDTLQKVNMAKHQGDMAAKLTQIEASSNVDVPGALI